jgi:hypothetical protein
MATAVNDAWGKSDSRIHSAGSVRIGSLLESGTLSKPASWPLILRANCTVAFE